jgi:hypothetical protein
MADTNLRTIKKKQGDTWVNVRMQDLSAGDVFKIFEDDEQIGGEWSACTGPTCDDGVWGINCADTGQGINDHSN